MDLARIDQIIDKYEGKPDSVIQVLLEIQAENHWIPPQALQRVSGRLDVPMNKVQHVATFHRTFVLVPQGKHEVHVCNGTSCHARGSARILDRVEELPGIAPGETDPDMKFSLRSVSCMGRCQSGPVMVVDGQHHEKMAPAKAEELVKQCRD
jgi:NADH-quinone oxidoreductase subunit E